MQTKVVGAIPFARFNFLFANFGIRFKLNGQNWGTPVVAGEGSQYITFVRFPKEMTKRHIKIVITEPKDQTGPWWSVAELYATSTKKESLVPPDVPTL